jgi:hypothetical protein
VTTGSASSCKLAFCVARAGTTLTTSFAREGISSRRGEFPNLFGFDCDREPGENLDVGPRGGELEPAGGGAVGNRCGPVEADAVARPDELLTNFT